MIGAVIVLPIQRLACNERLVVTDLCVLAGVVTYVATHLSPVRAEVDCLGSGNSDIDREGRFACLPLHDPCSLLISMHDSNVRPPNLRGLSGSSAFKRVAQGCSPVHIRKIALGVISTIHHQRTAASDIALTQEPKLHSDESLART